MKPVARASSMMIAASVIVAAARPNTPIACSFSDGASVAQVVSVEA